MYRAYENPYKIQKMLDEVKQEIEAAAERGVDDEDMFYLHERKYELEDRLRFAWADDEAELNGWD